MDQIFANLLVDVISTVFFTILGCALMWAVWKVIDWATPFPVLKEIEQDQNVALSVLFGFIFLSIAIIIAAVIVS
ncbi:DUF350 domain-containing protein [Paracoccus saliphilus]|uniref:DUF350 domain-containing protein n=1 Tax=Paracoccus saliphilus TaxID=405559 RepID=A0AA46A3T9_9RHOB|nr:DUF350 domain-containing protein [Paracoccus saliphilus]WCR03263.1 DUF350 domain-containing protein [Paracoccus saliphilus]SIS50439.1 protein of unknown function [Paracoccus saliphilus]